MRLIGVIKRKSEKTILLHNPLHIYRNRFLIFYDYFLFNINQLK